MKRYTFLLLATLVLALSLFAACGNQAAPTAAPATAVPINTPEPSPTATPEPTPEPTPSPEPTPEPVREPEDTPLDSGDCGEDVTWALHEDGSLWLHGSGEILIWALSPSASIRSTFIITAQRNSGRAL